jgi:hypothetical protein
MDSEDLFLVAALLSAGALLRFILVLFGELITPNVLVAFYSIAIMLILPSFGEAIGIGLVSGIITALISQSLEHSDQPSSFSQQVINENPLYSYLEFWLQLSFLSRASAQEPLVF